MSLFGLLAYNKGLAASSLGMTAGKQDAGKVSGPPVRPPYAPASQGKGTTGIHPRPQSPQKRHLLHRLRLRPQLAEKRTLTETILKSPHVRSAPARHDARAVDEAYILAFKLEALHQADLAGRERLVPSADPSLFDTDREAFSAVVSEAPRMPESNESESPDRYPRYSRWGRRQRKGIDCSGGGPAGG